MKNAELIKALRYCAEHEVCDYYIAKDCPRESTWMCGVDCNQILMLDAAAALEAAEKRIAELEAQLPKEGEWIEANTRPRSAQFYCSVCHRTCYDIQPTRDKAWTKWCRYRFCPNCGADMRKGETDDNA